MKLDRYYRAECACGLHRFVAAFSTWNALEKLEALGWTDVCIRCTEVRNG